MSNSKGRGSTQAPLVSIGMPVYNGSDVIAEAIESVLAQTVTDLELIIADNASTDDTESICRAYAERDPRIWYHRHPENLGAARNHNFTVEQSRGAYFKWMAHDDVIAPTYLARCLECFHAGGPKTVLCYTRRQTMTYEGQLITLPGDRNGNDGANGGGAADNGLGGARRLTPQPGPSFRELLQRPADECPMFVFGLMRRSALTQTRGMGTFPSADLVLVAEMRLLGEFGEWPEPLYLQRRHRRDEQWLARASKRGEARWYDPRDISRPRISSWSLFTEHLRGIATRPIPAGDKLRAYVAMGSYFPVRIRRLIRKRTLVQRLREELSPTADPRLY